MKQFAIMEAKSYLNILQNIEWRLNILLKKSASLGYCQLNCKYMILILAQSTGRLNLDQFS
jgi:hypothetical protein